MTMLITILTTLLISILVWWVLLVDQKHNELMEREIEMLLHDRMSNPQCEKKWSAESHFDRIAKVSEGIQKEAESQEPYILTLWWGIDGLKLKEDGTTEWIRKAERKYEVSGGAGGVGSTYLYPYSSVYWPPAQSLQALQSQIQSFQSQQAVQMQSVLLPQQLANAIRGEDGRLARQSMQFTGTL